MADPPGATDMAAKSGSMARLCRAHVRPAAGLVEDPAVGRLVIDPDRLEGREFLPAGDARDGEPLPVCKLPDPDRATNEAGWVGVGFERVVGNEAGLVFLRSGASRNWLLWIARARTARQQSRRKFSSAASTTRRKDARFQINQVGSVLCFRPCGRYNKFNVQRHLISQRIQRQFRTAAHNSWTDATVAAA